MLNKGVALSPGGFSVVLLGRRWTWVSIACQVTPKAKTDTKPLSFGTYIPGIRGWPLRAEGHLSSTSMMSQPEAQ
jgi:hypothetical protein